MAKQIKTPSFELVDGGNTVITKITLLAGQGGGFDGDDYQLVHLAYHEEVINTLKNPRIVSVIFEDGSNPGNFYTNPGYAKLIKSGQTYSLYFYLLKQFAGVTLPESWTGSFEVIVASDPE